MRMFWYTLFSDNYIYILMQYFYNFMTALSGPAKRRKTALARARTHEDCRSGGVSHGVVHGLSGVIRQRRELRRKSDQDLQSELFEVSK